MIKQEKETIDVLLQKAKNKFLLSNAVAKRAKQITDGSLPYVNDFDPTNPVITAIREIVRDKVRIKISTEESKKPVEVKVVDVAGEEDSIMTKLAKGAKSTKKKK